MQPRRSDARVSCLSENTDSVADVSAPGPDTGLAPAFSSSAAEAFSIAIVGDLHLEKKGMQMFNRARQQLKSALEEPGSGQARVVQLGDLGGYNEKPGRAASVLHVLLSVLMQYTVAL